nr:MAG TPA: hypothetical protein [Caudoviricetes sp.]
MGYKAFSKGMICQGKQYAENSVFEEIGADSCCKKGVMHYCETPFDCLDYYPLVDDNGDFTEFAEVEPLDKVLVQDNKRATKKLKIGAKLSFKDFIKAGISVLIESTKDIPNGENSSGYGAKIGSSGDWAKIGSSGDRAQIGSSGNRAQIGSSGYGAKIGSSGDRAVVSAIGFNSKIKAKIGSWIVLAEYDEDSKPVCVRAAQIDGEKLKPDTFYTLKNGEFIETEMED